YFWAASSFLFFVFSALLFANSSASFKAFRESSLFEEDGVEKDDVEEDSIEKDGVDEDGVEKDSVEEDNVEKNDVEELLFC
ncbi:12267_t:CDS:2, partial [Cetraspora pellucida]